MARRFRTGQRQHGIDRQRQHAETRGKQRGVADAMDRCDGRVSRRGIESNRVVQTGRHREKQAADLGLAVSHDCEKVQALESRQGGGAVDQRSQGEKHRPDVLQHDPVQLHCPVPRLPFHRLLSARYGRPIVGDVRKARTDSEEKSADIPQAIEKARKDFSRS